VVGGRIIGVVHVAVVGGRLGGVHGTRRPVPGRHGNRIISSQRGQDLI